MLCCSHPIRTAPYACLGRSWHEVSHQARNVRCCALHVWVGFPSTFFPYPRELLAMFVVSTKYRKQPARTAAPRYQTELRPERRMRMRVASAWVLTCVVLRPAMHMRWRDGRSAQGARDWEGSCDRGGGVGRLVPAVHASRTQPYMT
jgi:hypothetical protein